MALSLPRYNAYFFFFFDDSPLNPFSLAWPQASATKPNFEVGASSKLKFGAKKAPAAKTVWVLSATDGDDDGAELIDENDLLTSDDLVKPNPTYGMLCMTGPRIR